MSNRGARRTAVVTAAVGLVAAAVDTDHVRAAATPDRHAKYVSSALSSVSVAPRSTQAWALGNLDTRSGSRSFYVVHGSGGKWRRVAMRGTGGSYLYDIAAGSPKAIWVVGGTAFGDASTPFVEHSTGGAFTPEDVSGLAGSDLAVVAASSATNVWAAGRTLTFAGSTPFVARRSGGTWQQEPDDVQNGDGLISISTSAPDNTWILGTKTRRADVAVWDGHQLAGMPLPLPKRGVAQDIATTGPDDTWMVGWVERKPGRHLGSLIEHWNGHRWKRFAAPSPSYNSQLTSVSAAGKNVYATGVGTPSSPVSNSETPYLLRFRHGKWARVHTPTRSKRSNLVALSVSSKAGAAVGYYSGMTANHEPTELSFAVTLSGKTWRAAAVPG